MIFIEGDDDQRFLERVVAPLLRCRFDAIRFYRYAPCPHKEVSKLIRTLKHTGWEYLFLADKDSSPCITQKRGKIAERMPNVDQKKVIVVESEIESWYAAGVSVPVALEVGFTHPQKSDAFTKEHLLRCVNKRLPTATDIRLKLLDNYSLDLGRNRSRSLEYFCKKLNI